jgi:heparan-alpha-glucosaminide N-acetyltransferase
MVPDRDLAARRLASLDAYRGFVMLAMASGGAAIFGSTPQAPDTTWTTLLQSLSQQFEHVDWRGCSIWDLIQPSFMFLVGAAMPFSYANRRARGDSRARLLGHAVVRSLVLILLAIFLSSQASRQTNFVFTNVLAQIGLGYMFVFLILGLSPRVQLGAALAILVAYWLLFALYPVDQNVFFHGARGVDPEGTRLPGYFAHWNWQRNPAVAFDRWFLNLFPRSGGTPFVLDAEGYATLNFIPSIATMIFGVLAGELLRSPRPAAEATKILLAAGAIGYLSGRGMDHYVCPVVKRIWTPSWVLLSTGWCCWILAAFHSAIELAGARRWAFPLIVVGMNSIAMYLMAQLLKPFVRRSLTTHFGPHLFSGAWGPLHEALAVLLVFWLVCYWLYRQRYFIKL